MKTNNLRILQKAYAYLQTMIKTPIKFQKDRSKTVKELGSQGTYFTRNHASPIMHYGKPNTMSPSFSSKMRGTTKRSEEESSVGEALALAFHWTCFCSALLVIFALYSPAPLEDLWYGSRTTMKMLYAKDFLWRKWTRGKKGWRDIERQKSLQYLLY